MVYLFAGPKTAATQACTKERSIKDHTSRRAEHPLVSVIVPVHNAAAVLGRCLDAVVASSYPEVEVLVVDDRSTDDPESLARARGCRFVRLGQGWGAAAARNAGARAARGALLLFIDADVVIPADAIERTVQRLAAAPRICGLSAVYTAVAGAPGLVSRYLNFKTHHFQVSLPPSPDTVYSAYLALWRPCFESVGGFDEAQTYVAADDLVLGLQLAEAGCCLEFSLEIQVTHQKRLSLAGLMEFEYRHAREWAAASRVYPRLLAQRLTYSRRSSVGALLAAWLLASGTTAALGLAVTWNPAWLACPALPALALAGWNAGFLGLVLREGGLADAAVALPLSTAGSAAAMAGAGAGWLAAHLRGASGEALSGGARP